MNKENSERSQNLKEGDQVVLLTKAGAGLVRPVRGEVTGHKDQIVLGGEDEPQHGTVFSIRLEEGRRAARSGPCWSCPTPRRRHSRRERRAWWR